MTITIDLDKSVLDGILLKLKNKYEYQKKLGEGLFTKTYLLRHKIHQEDHALKIMDVSYILRTLEKGDFQDSVQEFEKIKENFIEELDSFWKIDHPNIIKIYDRDVMERETDGIEIPYIIMQYVNGTPLHHIIKESSPLEIGRVNSISRNILDAIAVIHERGIIHKDIKPANIMIEKESGNAILIDFGITKDILKDPIISVTGGRPGIEFYMSPEQFMGSSDIGKATDIYSFGVILYEMLAGEPPFKGKPFEVANAHLNAPIPDIREINPELPKGIERVIETAMAKKPSDRFASAEEFKQSLLKADARLEDDNDWKEVDAKIGGTYETEYCLYTGNWFKVYRVRHRRLGSFRILKIMRYSQLKEKDEKYVRKFTNRLVREAQLLANLKHENIVKIYDINTTKKNDIPYLIMEYVEGKNLAQLLKNQKPLNFEHSLKIASGTLSALREMHRQKKPIIHRDIKPENIIIEKRDEKEDIGSPILIDFGLAKSIRDTSSLTATKEVIGSFFYMPPEQWKGMSKVDTASDVYAFGVVFFEMLTGERPFKGDDASTLMHEHLDANVPNVRKINPSLPGGVEKIIEKAMAKKPKDRYRDAGEFLAALEEIRDNYEVETAADVNVESNNNPERIEKTVKKQKVEEESDRELLEVDEEKGNMKIDKEQEGVNEKEIDKVEDGQKQQPGKIDEVECGSKNKVSREKTIKFLVLIFIVLMVIYMGKDTTKGIMDGMLPLSCGNSAKKAGLERHEEKKRAELEKYEKIKNNINLSNYLEFEYKYPKSGFIGDLRIRLRNADKHLPPEKYWSETLAKSKNDKGYYEKTFTINKNGDHTHTMIYIPEKNFWIDKYEVSIGQFNKFDNMVTGRPDCPAFATYEQAKAYCREYGFRLPTQDEWEYAAGKEFGRIYPWGDDPPKDGNNLYRANFKSLKGEPCNGKSPVWRFKAYCSPFGVVNMAGNAWEWVGGRLLKGGGGWSGPGELSISTTRQKGVNEKTIAGFRCIKYDKED
ncbi:MAG: protein kinase [Candidatus Aminicenantes bacterium]|nr:protein kinase [Candidatus Aminicenantes bacterium]